MTSLDGASISKSRLHAMCIGFQKRKGHILTNLLNLQLMQHTICMHLRTYQVAFGARKMGRGQSMFADHRWNVNVGGLPDRPRKKACVRYVKDDNKWFEWHGTEKQQPIVEVLPQRDTYFMTFFQNVSCKAISESKFQNEARRVICRAAFAHNKSKMLLGLLWRLILTRHDSHRCYFSHDFKYCLYVT